MTQPLTPPPKHLHQPQRLHPRSRFPRIWVVLLFVVLFSALGAVFVLLPQWVRHGGETRQGPTQADLARPVDRGEANQHSGETTTAEPDSAPIAEAPKPESALALEPEPEPAPPPQPKAPTVIAGPVFVEDQTQAAQNAPDPFSLAVSQGMSAVQRKDFKAARDAYIRADKLKPGTPLVAEALAHLQQIELLNSIQNLLGVAKTQEEQENWRGAEKTYGIILGLDDTVAFAIEGRKRSKHFAALHEAVDYHLSNPARLASPAVLSEASLIQKRAAALNGAKLQEKAQTLAALLTAWRTPLPVTLQSDGQTQILVYKVGRMGAFTSKSLELRPGTYVITGSRNGYRDVRKELVVQPGRPPEALMIQCEEKI